MQHLSQIFSTTSRICELKNTVLPSAAYQLKKVMKQHAAEGNTVFFSSHILDVVENICDRCCIIEKSHLKGVYDLAELRQNGKSLEKIFMKITGEIEEDE